MLGGGFELGCILKSRFALVNDNDTGNLTGSLLDGVIGNLTPSNIANLDSV